MATGPKLADSYPPLHNLSTFNPAEFPDTDPNPINLGAFGAIDADVITNATTINSNTSIITNFNIFGGYTIPATQLKYNGSYAIPFLNSAPPVGTAYMLIINLNLTVGTGGTSINRVECILSKGKNTLISNQTWNQSTSDSVNNFQTAICPQFVFTGVGTGELISLRFQCFGANNNLGTLGALNINSQFNIGNYSNDVMMLWL